MIGFGQKKGALQQEQRYRTQEQQQEQVSTAAPREGFNFSFKKEDETDKELRKPRSRAYMEIFAAADMLSAADEEIIERLKAGMDEETAEEFSEMSAEELAEEIRQSFTEEFAAINQELKSRLLGVLSTCYISGCDCHAISPEGRILEHFKFNAPLPQGLEKGRRLLKQYPDCTCVEVYGNCCRVVMSDSTVLKVEDN